MILPFTTEKVYSSVGKELSDFDLTSGIFLVFNDATETTFMTELYEAYLDYCDTQANLSQLGEPDLSGHRKLRTALLGGLIMAVEYFFRERDVDDENWCTPDEIWDCIQHINNIMDTVLYIDLSDY
jgi:hypothetical protein